MKWDEILLSLPVAAGAIWLLIKVNSNRKYRNYNDSYRKRKSDH